MAAKGGHIQNFSVVLLRHAKKSKYGTAKKV